MTNFPVDIEEHWRQVPQYLAGALPECEVTSESRVSDQAPMIFMWMANLMAGFALSNGDTFESYKKLFGSFKEYYAENRNRLDVLELSFVFCVRPDLPDLEAFCSKVETDVYFCRKFVIPLANSLDRAFERLPFVPLALGTEGLRRPPSAQTYMRECGVPATLAKYLAVPHQRGAENIVRDCLDESSNWTPLLAGQSRARMSVAESQREDEKWVHLDAVAIQNFRAYKRRQVFDLGRAVTVLYGPNGFGKTSFFDAVDFAATGGVGRLGLSARTDRFARAVAHLDGKPEDASVGLRFGANGLVRRISRRVSSRAQASVDGISHGRKRALVEVTGGGLEASDRIEHLVSLFRATHLFGQGRPELGKGFDRDCALPPQVVSHMLAFDDYANTRRKALEVCDVLEQALGRERGSIALLGREIEEAELNIGNLEEASTQYLELAAPAKALASLRRRVQDAGLSVESEEGDRVFVRACRAAIQARLGDGEARIRRLTELVEEARLLPAVTEGVAELAKRRRGAESELGSAEEALGQAEAAQGEAAGLVQKLEARLVEGRARAEALRWAREAQPRYRRLVKLEGEGASRVQKAIGGLGELRERQRGLVRDLRAKEQTAERALSEVARTRGVVAQLRKLEDGADRWRSDVAAVGEARAREETLGGQLEQLRRQEETLSSRLVENRALQGVVREEIEPLEREQSNFSQLLGQIGEHIRDAVCPLCGHDHGSLEVLLEEVEKRRTRDAVGDLRAKAGALKKAGEDVERRLAELRRDVAVHSDEVQELRKQRERRETRIASFEDAVGRVGIAAQELKVAAGAINERWARERDDLERMERVSVGLQMEVKGAKAAIAQVEGEIEDGESAVAEAERELDDCREQLKRLREDRRTAEVSLGAEPTALGEAHDRQLGELRETDAAVLAAAGVAKERRAAVAGLRQKISALGTALGGLKKQMGERTRALTETNARLVEFGLAVGAEYKEVVDLLEDETKTNSRLEELRDFADSVELGLDTATTAAALRQQRQAVRSRERRIEERRQDIEKYESWRSYFAELGERVAGRQNAAIANFANEYGPTASAIQERLRSVYGFDGIDTRSHEATIRVLVRRGSESLRPTDYFSDSQQRTLLLGLFLTASISQSWSSLATVLLDDPVMHFDDLNTYAFLDMVAGFLDAQSGPGQFVISTCDRKVLQLARKRFRHLEGDARFYEFSAIGRDGPVVEEVAAL